MDTKVIIFSILVSVLVFDITSCDGCSVTSCDGTLVCEILADITGQISSLHEKIDFIVQPGLSEAFPADSCDALLQANSSTPSGYYWIRSSDGSAVSVYCDMTRSCGGVTGGWMRVAELDMTVNSQCPSGLMLRTDPDKRTCVSSIDGNSCSSVIYSTQNVRYSKVCGKVRAYQYASPDGFHSSQIIDNPYVDGISLTHGNNPRQHIWTFVSILQSFYQCSNCVDIPPSYVGTDFFCDSGSQNAWQYIFYGDDPLWDGQTFDQECSPNNPPWFFKQLSQTTTDDVEMRLCRDQGRGDEDIALEAVDIYVQ